MRKKALPTKDSHDSNSNCTSKPHRHSHRTSSAEVVRKISYRAQTKPKLLRYKNTVNIATFNDSALNLVNQLPELTTSTSENNVDIIYIQAHRYYLGELDMIIL